MTESLFKEDLDFPMHFQKANNLQGWVQFPTGGKARERCRASQIRLNSEADSKVWMEEDRIVVLMTICIPEVILQGFLFF
jgi:hypothetical protein